jgi:hypothetical protein
MHPHYNIPLMNCVDLFVIYLCACVCRMVAVGDRMLAHLHMACLNVGCTPQGIEHR